MRLTRLLIIFVLVITGVHCGTEGETDPAHGDSNESLDSAALDPGADVTMGETSQEDASTAGPEASVTYHGTIRGLMEENCVSCHVSGGGGPFPLTYDASEWSDGAPWWTSSVVRAVGEGSMPPWKPAEDCRPIQHERVLSSEAIAAFETWQSEGFAEGEPGSYVAPEPSGAAALGEATMRLDAGEAYVADTSSPDDYRCFLVGEVLEEDLYIKALGVDPDQDSIVHHVLIYAVDPEEVAKVEGKNANEEGLGYTCFGGPGASNPSTLFAWAPGGVPLQLPDGAAIKVDKGSRLVMQLHYNLAYLGADETPPADKSAALVWTMAADEAPDKLVRIVPFADLGLSIEAGDADAFNERDFLLPYTSTIIGVVPHMHVLGTAIRSEHIDPDGETTCLVDIPEWDFNWQQFYLYDEAQYVAGDAGDIHRVSCSYDNSQANQPIINGEQQPPQDVEWGDGTFDEMCLSYLVLMTAFDIDGGVCNGLEACSQTCDAGDFLCFLGCTLVPGATCIQCVGTPLIVDCGNAVCPDEAAEAIGCFTGHDACADDPLSCLTDTCLSELNTLYGCLHEPVQQGQCNDILAECDVSF